ncbi:hypothetical protein ROZALSC1DRAFT_28915 [Rozella allomycis CSF55]|uniref:Uncharacterized protein n=1 Tax=Rozella allomycis (strain CSF55) TaxID=988480 RepID=A0A075AVY9_ROZAC|nr:hypothetical protein O9G_003807 [Rozella allomycis CSF55]RKP19494.1 hypothetical protein ROZALSC1DRAFT_28915 [Rozella allomycis CSF55]|eukprot:EPZ32679.1 hypothetical protein O9G_003807 [Rozella allomycis CSF55]
MGVLSLGAFRMGWRGPGSDVFLSCEYDHCVCSADLCTFDENDIDFDIERPDNYCRIVCKADWFKKLISEIPVNTDILTFILSPGDISLTLEGIGPSGSTKIEIRRSCPHIDGVIVPARFEQSWYYFTNLASYCNKIATLANKIAITFSEQGTLSIQFMVPFNSHNCFLEIMCSSLEDT